LEEMMKNSFVDQLIPVEAEVEVIKPQENVEEVPV